MISYFIKDARLPFLKRVVAEGNSLEEVEKDFQKKFGQPVKKCVWAYYEIQMPAPNPKHRPRPISEMVQDEEKEARLLARYERRRVNRGGIVKESNVRALDENGFETNMFDSRGFVQP